MRRVSRRRSQQREIALDVVLSAALMAIDLLSCHSARRRAFAVFLTLACALSGCSHSVRVRHEVPIQTAQGRSCAKRCFETQPRGTRAACLRHCPNAREVEEASCARVDKKRVACAEEKRTESGVPPLLVIVGTAILVNALIVLTILAD